jgi:5-methylcytosine-specific restriction endonuclease McrA
MVFVISSNGAPLDPCHEARARELLKKGRAAVWRMFPLTIKLKDRTRAESVVATHCLKLDPGSKTTGIAVVQEGTGRVVFAAELTHRGQAIRDALLARRGIRRSRRQRKTRYRPARFDNRRRPKGWLAPSLLHRVLTTENWVNRLRRFCPVTALSVELAKFDTQLMQNPEISGVEYQRGELLGWEVRAYLLEKWGRRCAYCGTENVPFEIDHVTPRDRGGSDRVSNLALACHDCNQAKGNRTAEEFGHPEVQAQARAPLKDAAVVNATRLALYRRLLMTGLPIEVGSGGRTRYNRARLNLSKAHFLDAACVGASTPDNLRVAVTSVLLIAAKGHGSRQMCRTDEFGFPRRHVPRQKRWFGFKTGDLVKAVVPKGKYAGTHVGRVSIRTSGKFNITTASGLVQGISHRHCQVIQRVDGYAYATRKEERA